MLLLLACTEPFPCAADEVLDAKGNCLAIPTPEDDTAVDTHTAVDTDTSGDTDTGDTARVDEDRDGWSTEEGDCDDTDAARGPGFDEQCDGIDNNCDEALWDRELLDEDADGDPACLDCDDLDGTIKTSDGSCAAFEFPLGFLSVEDSADFPRLVDLGITHVQAYNFGPWPSSDLATDIAWSQAYLAEAEANGLKVLANLNADSRAEVGAPLADFEAFVAAVQGYSSLAAWYIADEPEFSVTAPQLYEMQGVLDAATPDVPVHVAHCWCTGWWDFWYVGDTRMPDFYGIYADEIPTDNAKYHPTFTSYVKGYYTDSRIAPAMQAFSYAVYSDDDPVTYPPDSRLPTREELRFWAFSDLALGVDELWWWSWYRGNQTDGGPEWLDTTFRESLQELRRFTDEVRPASNPVVVAPGPQEITEYTYLAYWPRPNAIYVVATNGSASARTLDIKLGDTFANASLAPWDATTPALTLDAEGGASVDAEPYEVMVWVFGR